MARKAVGLIMQEPAELSAKPCVRLVAVRTNKKYKPDWHTLGQCFPKKVMFLRKDCGTATEGTDKKYEMNTLMTGEPLIRSSKTGKFFLLSWRDIINLAELCGIDKEDAPEKDCEHDDEKLDDGHGGANQLYRCRKCGRKVRD